MMLRKNTHGTALRPVKANGARMAFDALWEYWGRDGWHLDGYAWRVQTGNTVRLSRPRCECGNRFRLCHPEA